MPKGRRTNNRHKRKRMPAPAPGEDHLRRGTQSGRLERDSLAILSTKARHERHIREAMALPPEPWWRRLQRKTASKLKGGNQGAGPAVLRRRKT